MKHVLIAITIIVSILSVVTAQAADVGMSISIGQPGFYGHIDIGNFPRPEVVYAKPIVVAPPRSRIVAEPLYLHVPPGHAKKWSRYCSRYNACGRPVYFVKDRWYNDVYVPRYRERHSNGPDRDHDRNRDYSRGPDRDRVGKGDKDRGNEHGRN